MGCGATGFIRAMGFAEKAFAGIPNNYLWHVTGTLLIGLRIYVAGPRVTTRLRVSALQDILTGSSGPFAASARSLAELSRRKVSAAVILPDSRLWQLKRVTFSTCEARTCPAFSAWLTSNPQNRRCRRDTCGPKPIHSGPGGSARNP